MPPAFGLICSTISEIQQLRTEYEACRSGYVESLAFFLAQNAGRIRTVKWAVENSTGTPGHRDLEIRLVRDDGEAFSPPNKDAIDLGYVSVEDFVPSQGICEAYRACEYAGIEDERLMDAAFSRWAGISSRVGLQLANVAYEFLRAQPDLALSGELAIESLQVA